MNAHTHNGTCCSQEHQEGRQYARDPVCGMEVAVGDSTLHYKHEERDYYFCSDHCLKSFSGNIDRYLNQEQKHPGRETGINPLYAGLSGMAGLLFVFFGVVFLANGSIESALREFNRLWYWVLLLAGGFGFQLGLFFHIRKTVKEKMAGATAEVAASGTISTGSMVACCAHGLVNLLPVLGLSAAAAFLARYQLPLILLGVFSNLFGITIMLGIARKHDALPHNLPWRLVSKGNLTIARYATLIIGILVIIGSSYWSYINS